MKKALESRGAKTIRGLGRVFRTFDSYDGNKKIDRQEFYVGLCEMGVEVSRNEANVKFRINGYLGTDGLFGHGQRWDS